MENGYQCEILEHAAFQMTSSLDLKEVLSTITKGLVAELDAPAGANLAAKTRRYLRQMPQGFQLQQS